MHTTHDSMGGNKGLFAMKLKLFITHLLTLVIGFGLASSYFVFDVIPSTARHIVADPQYIKLTNDTEPVEYNEVLQQDYLGSLYLRNPVYFFKRQQGYDMLEHLANKGYTSAATHLHGYHILRAIYHYPNYEKANIEFAKAHKWAKVAAAQGMPAYLLSMLNADRSYVAETTPEEMAMLEEAAKNSSIGTSAEWVSEYYSKIGEDEKAAEWMAIADNIWASDPPKPACSTITPWKGW